MIFSHVKGYGIFTSEKKKKKKKKKHGRVIFTLRFGLLLLSSLFANRYLSHFIFFELLNSIGCHKRCPYWHPILLSSNFSVSEQKYKVFGFHFLI